MISFWKKIREKVSSPTAAKIIPLLFFVVFLVVGLVVVKDYGVSWDEGVQRQHLLVNLRYVYKTFNWRVPENLEAFWSAGQEADYFEMENYPFKTYGVAMQFIPAVAEAIFDFELPSRYVYLSRHWLTFLTFFGATVCLFFLGKRMGKRNYCWALLGSVFLVLSPRIFGHAFFNIKDALFLSVMVINAWLGIYWLEKPTSVWRMLFFSLASAVCINTRVIGGIIPFICWLILLIKILDLKNSNKLTVIRKWTWALVATVILTFGFWVAVTPAAWTSPFEHLIETVGMFADFSLWDDSMLFMGEMVPAANLPWYYLPVWVIVTTPLLYSGLFLIGVIFLAKRIGQLFSRIVNQGKNLTSRVSVEKQDCSWIKILAEIEPTRMLVFFMAIIPLAAVMLLQPRIYDGWRHFYFIYPFMLLVSVDGLWELVHAEIIVQKKWLKKIIFGIIIINQIGVGWWMVKNHPYQYAYFSWPWKKNVAMNFTRDYWNVTYYNQLKEILKREKLYPIAVGTTNEGLWQNYVLLNGSDQKKFDFESDDPLYIIFSSRDVKGDDWEIAGYDLVQTLEIDGYKINAIFKKDDFN